MENFSVEFDQPIAVYLPGQTVSGYVQFRLTAAESFKGLKVECIGKSQVQWTETETTSRDTETIHYQASENYFYHNVLLFSEGDFAPQYYRYPFSFVLPIQLPASFEGTYGSLRYYIQATLGRRYVLDAVFKRGFSVNTIVDLNENPQSSIPVTNEDTKTVCCLWCQSGPITAVAWLPKSGYVPGETILFCGRVDNRSGRTLHTTVRLVESTIFKAQGKQKKNERVIVETSLTSQPNGSPNMWKDIAIGVPPMAPSGLQYCTLIELQYFLEFVINPGTLSFNLKVPIEITIGTVPLRESFSTFQAQPSTQPTAPPLSVTNENGIVQPIGFLPPFLLNQYPNLPSHTGQTGLFSGNLRDEGDTEHLNIGFDTLFKPVYISYAQPETHK